MKLRHAHALALVAVGLVLLVGAAGVVHPAFGMALAGMLFVLIGLYSELGDRR